MAASPGRGRNEPEPTPIIVKKIIAEAHDAHHGGQWKVAYADFVTAMMAFFMLMWLLSITDQQKRQGLAEYFTPTPLEMKRDSAGANGILGGDSIHSDQNFPSKATTSATMAITLPDAPTDLRDEGERRRDRARFEQLRRTTRWVVRPSCATSSRTSASPRRSKACASTSSTTPISRCSTSVPTGCCRRR